MVRLRNRYLLCEINFDDQRTNIAVMSNDLLNEIKQSVVTMHGDYGIGSVMPGFNVKYLNPYTRIFIVRSRRRSYKFVSTALPFMKKLLDKPCRITTLHCGGTIRSCQKFLLKYQRQQLSAVLLKCKTDPEQKKVKESILKCTLKDVEGEGCLEEEEDIDSS
ncbi:ribonuclease P/MRP protein subunit POP5-like [Antedon mediterranea]|uniref:ribonuclease P/MRP protein subunit POP5-like n=1 Tax=Antedon mediterranea TaxID=105859 RepID=UPI003AF74BF0